MATEPAGSACTSAGLARSTQAPWSPVRNTATSPLVVVSPLLNGTARLVVPGRVSSRTSSAVPGESSFIVVVRASSQRLRARSVPSLTS